MAALDKQVAAQTDDCRVQWNGSSWALATDKTAIQAGWNLTTMQKQGCGLRFLNITIPKGATIDAAYITITCRLAKSNTTVNSKVRGEDVDDAATFSNYADYAARARTAAEVNWDNIGAWSVGVEYNSPEIKTVIQEIINRAGWSSGNDLVIFWDDHDDRSTHANDTNRVGEGHAGISAKAAKLHIEYTIAAVGRSRGYIIG